MADFDDEFFRQWQAGNEDARNQMWELLWQKLYTVAIVFCRSLTRNPALAEEWATDAFNRAVLELDAMVQAEKVEWHSLPSFLAFARNRIIFRCRDAALPGWQAQSRYVTPDPGDMDDEVDFFDTYEAEEPSPEMQLLRQERISKILGVLLAAREVCCRQKTLVEVLISMQSYFRQCLSKTISPPIDTTALRWEELLARANLSGLQLDQTEMYEFVMQDCGLTRNQFDQRMKRLRPVLLGLRHMLDD